MKRDMELVRKLLFFFDEKPGPEFVKVPPIAGRTDLEIRYHVVLMYQAGMLSGEPSVSSTSDRIIDVLPFDLTWEGHEFLELVRDETLWEKARARTSAAAGGGGLLALKTVLVELVKQSIGSII